ncbi:putative disease resistance protein RGA3 [Triticum urartu]|uniref:putative disease resistance protein RGA3 n=1 Tax=Triticum urartu TaxID=4572 RepID=UPI00204466DB|nr:putative disease resistance protein RGA3 [Triticum urartu]
MAMVLDAFASFIGDYLKQVVQYELGTMLGVSGEIHKLGDRLQDLKNFLADADRRNITDETVQVWVAQLKRAMYEAADILDLCQLKAMEKRGPSSAEAGCCNPLLFCMRNPFHAREIGTRIKALNQRLDSIKQHSAAFNFINLGSYEDCHSSNAHASRHGNPSRETVGDFDRSAIVGDKIEEDTRALVAQIMQKGKDVNNGIKVVSIVGVGGIGKTTLAQKVFNDNTIQGEFSKKIWLSVNQNFSDVDLLRRVIIEAGGGAQPPESSKTSLHKTLKNTLIDHKTFLVMDDVWNHRAWDDVLKIPLDNAAASGSRVLVTTRDEGVARGVKAMWPYHHVDAWSLLKKQACSSEIDEDHINTLKDIRLEIIQKCDCLPIAVKVMGGLLRESGGLRRDWQQVLDDSKWSTTKLPDDLNHTVYLSYEYMPSYLKQCFLYYSFLPKSRIFNIDKVVAMWISEGFIQGNSSDLEELGRNYYKELVSRSMIEPDKFLRTLHIESADMAVLVESLYQLKHLRYLALVNADISILPENIGKMKLLQFLVLVGCIKLVNLPDSIVKLGQLRLLSLPGGCMVPRGFSGLTNMRRLSIFQAHMYI